MSTTDDISIAKDKWIKWIEFDSAENQLFNIDELLEPTWSFWKLLETECVAECCGIDAFSFWTEDIQQAAMIFDKSKLLTQLILLKAEIVTQNNQIIISSRLKLNNLFDKSVFIQLIDHIIKSINNMTR